MDKYSDFVPALALGGVKRHILEVQSEENLHHVQYPDIVHTDQKVLKFHPIQ